MESLTYKYTEHIIPKTRNTIAPKADVLECTTHDTIKQDGFYVCRNCGLVKNRVLDDRPRRAFTAQEKANRKKNEPVYSPIGPRTVIKGWHDAKGKILGGNNINTFRRLSKIHRSLISSFERNLWIALPTLQSLEHNHNLPETVVKDALRIYSKAVKEKLTMGRTIDILLAASIHAALRIHGFPRPIEELCRGKQFPIKRVSKAYRLIVLQILPQLKIKIPALDPSVYIDQFCQKLELSMAVRNQALKLLNKVEDSNIHKEGKDPKGFAAGAIYLSAKKTKNRKTQTEVSQVAHVTEVTIRMRAREIEKCL